MMNIRSYKKMMRELAIGDTFYMNAINCSIAMAEKRDALVTDVDSTSETSGQ